MKDVLVISHSPELGGAEKALVDTLQLLSKLPYRIHLLIPPGSDKFAKEVNQYNFQIIRCPNPWHTPSPHLGLYLSAKIAPYLQRYIRHHSVALVVSNTIATALGLRVANLSQIPHLTFCHEQLSKDEDLRPKSISADLYLELFDQTAQNIICASNYSASQFKCASTHILYPLSASVVKHHNVQTIDESQGETPTEFSLIWIGVQNTRKNPLLAVQILKLLCDVEPSRFSFELYLIGAEGSMTIALLELLKQQKHIHKKVHFTGFLPDPYYNIPKNPIALITADSEPFGLSAIETISRGIPTISTRCGGPTEFLAPQHLFTHPTEAVKAILEIVDTYKASSINARLRYESFASNFEQATRLSKVEKVILEAMGTPPPTWPPFFSVEHSIETFEGLIAEGKIGFTGNQEEAFSRLSNLSFVFIFILERLLQSKEQQVVLSLSDPREFAALSNELRVKLEDLGQNPQYSGIPPPKFTCLTTALSATSANPQSADFPEEESTVTRQVNQKSKSVVLVAEDSYIFNFTSVFDTLLLLNYPSVILISHTAHLGFEPATVLKHGYQLISTNAHPYGSLEVFRYQADSKSAGCAYA